MRAGEEAELLQGLRRRDPEAFTGLWDGRQKVLWSIALAVLEDPGRAEDALRQTIEWAWAECERASGSPALWLTSVLARVLSSPEFRPGEPSGPCTEGLRGQMQDALAALPGDERLLLVLHHLGGLDAGTLARLSCRDPRTVRLAIQRGTCAVAGLSDERGDPRETARRYAARRRNIVGGTHNASNPNGRSRRRVRVASWAREGPLRHR